jgi:hypothetical protein
LAAAEHGQADLDASPQQRPAPAPLAASEEPRETHPAGDETGLGGSEQLTGRFSGSEHEALPDDPFVTELLALVAPVAEPAATSIPTALRVPQASAEAPVDEGEFDVETWESQWTRQELSSAEAQREAEVAELEQEVAEFRQLHQPEPLNDPFDDLLALEQEILELQALRTKDRTAGADDATGEAIDPPGPTLSTSVESPVAPESKAAPQIVSAPVPPLSEEPLSLESFLLAESVTTEVAPAARTQTLRPLELELSLAAESKPWQDVVRALSRYLLDRQATRAAALLPRLLEGEPLRLERLSESVRKSLVAEGVAEYAGAHLVPTPEFRGRAARLHQAFLESRLDAPTVTGWLADIAHALLGASEPRDALLEDLRAAGVTDVVERAA